MEPNYWGKHCNYGHRFLYNRLQENKILLFKNYSLIFCWWRFIVIHVLKTARKKYFKIVIDFGVETGYINKVANDAANNLNLENRTAKRQRKTSRAPWRANGFCDGRLRRSEHSFPNFSVFVTYLLISDSQIKRPRVFGRWFASTV